MMPGFHDKTFKNGLPHDNIREHRPVYLKESENWFGIYPKPPALAGRGGIPAEMDTNTKILHNGDGMSNFDDAQGIKIMPPIFTFFVMLAFWTALSGKFDPFHLGMGGVFQRTGGLVVP